MTGSEQLPRFTGLKLDIVSLHLAGSLVGRSTDSGAVAAPELDIVILYGVAVIGVLDIAAMHICDFSARDRDVVALHSTRPVAAASVHIDDVVTALDRNMIADDIPAGQTVPAKNIALRFAVLEDHMIVRNRSRTA